jgi:choice-of-anchor A domain-containing protein
MNNLSTFICRSYTLLLLFTASVFTGAWTQSAGIQWLKNTHLITIENLTQVQQVDFTTFVGGDLVQINQSGAQMTAANYPNYATRSLEVTGKVHGGNDVNIFYSGAFSNTNTLVQQNSNQYTVNGRRFNLNNSNQGSTLVNDNTLNTKAAQIKSDLESASQILSQFTANNTVTFSNQGTELRFNVNTKDANGLAVFNVTKAQVFENSAISQMVINNNVNATTILINVSGTSVNWQSGANKIGNWFNGENGRSRTLWNFYEATSITMNRRFMGALLAPKATVTTDADINGSVAVKILNSSASVQKPGFAGDIAAPVPTIFFSGKVFLQGAYNATTGTMNLGLNPNGTAGLLPTTDPYGLGTSAPVNPNTIDGIVDWVKIEVRAANDATTILKSIAAFVKADGTLVNINNNTTIELVGLVPASYHISIKHRNHLSIYTPTPQLFNASGTVYYDFTTSLSKVMDNGNGNAMVQVGSKWCMWAGDYNQDEVIDGIDNSAVLNEFTRGYLDEYRTGDLNFDAFTDGLDRALMLVNLYIAPFSPFY